MDRFDDRTPLWDYRDDSIPDDRGGAARRNRRREQAYRRDDWDDWYAGERRRPYGDRESAWPAYESDDGRARYYEAVGEARGGRRAEDCVDAISGVKHVRNNLRYTSGVVSPKLD